MEDNVIIPEETENNAVETESTPIALETEETVATETIDSSALTQGVMKEKDIKQVTQRQRIVKICVQVGLYLFLGIMALIVLFPFYWMIISSLKSINEYYDPTLTIYQQLWPSEFMFKNYAAAFETANLAQLFHDIVPHRNGAVGIRVCPLGIQRQEYPLCFPVGNDDDSWRIVHHHQLHHGR